LAFDTTATRKFVFARSTLDEEEVTLQILAVSIVITNRLALVAVGEDIIRDPLTEALVKDKVLALEFGCETLTLYLVLVVNDATMELVYVLETVVFEIGTRLLTTNSTSTIEEYFFVLFTLKHLLCQR